MFSKKFLPIILIFVFIFTLSTQVFAASVGDTKSEVSTFTLAEINSCADDLFKAYTQEDYSFWISVLTEKIPLVGTIYSGAALLVKNDILKDYVFFSNIRTNMINNNYSKVDVKYTLEYRKTKINNEPFFGWWIKSKSASNYR